MEVFSAGVTGVIDNWRKPEIWPSQGKTVGRSWLRSQKGHQQELNAFIQAIQSGGSPPIALAELINTTRATFAIKQSIRTGQPVIIEA